MTINVPTTKVKVVSKYLGLANTIDCQEAYLIAVKGKPNEALAFTVHLENGALFSNLPLEALRRVDATESVTKVFDNETLQPYSCTEGPITLISYDYLKNYAGIAKVGGEEVEVRYMFTIDYEGQGLSDDPEQYKTHNLVKVLNNEQIAALPNNRILWFDNHFTKSAPGGWPNLKRNVRKYYAGS